MVGSSVEILLMIPIKPFLYTNEKDDKSNVIVVVIIVCYYPVA